MAAFPGYQLEYCLYPGQGPTLVLETAQGTDMQVWKPVFIERLTRFSTVLTYNRIGYGKSHFLDHPVQAPVTAKDSSQRLHQLLLRPSADRPVILVGHSIGGLYAQYFARAYPQQLAALVLIDAASALEPKKNSPFVNKSINPKGSIAYLEGQGFQPSVHQIERAPGFPDIPLLVISAADHRMPTDVEALWQQTQKQIAQQSPRGKQMTVPDSDHFVFQRHPEEVAEEIANLVRTGVAR